MSHRWISIALAGALAAPQASCKSVECGPGTIERDGACAPRDEAVSAAGCGPFTELRGDTCVPTFPPTVCDPATTTADLDMTTGVTTCVGTGMAGGCTGTFACPPPAAGKMTVCGQVYDFRDDAPYRLAAATGSKCDAPTATGACALKLVPYDAAAFATNPATATPLPSTLFIDDCGRFRLADIPAPASGLIGIGLDDAAAAGMGPAGVTQTTGAGIIFDPGAAHKDFEVYVASKATTDQWDASSGATGPKVSTGLYAVTYRAGKTGAATQAGVQVTKSNNVVPTPQAAYFAAGTSRTAIDPAATATTDNGSVLVSGASLADSLTWGGQSDFGADAATCQWENHGGVSLPFIVYVQNYRPANRPLQTCPR